jgi:hypothetical protein
MMNVDWGCNNAVQLYIIMLQCNGSPTYYYAGFSLLYFFFLPGHLLGQNLTVIPQFHSHFETMKFIDMKKSPSSEVS